MGTDQLGRDLLARMMYGGRVSVAVGLTAMLLGLFSARWSAFSRATSGGSTAADAHHRPLSRAAAAAAAADPGRAFPRRAEGMFGQATGVFILIVVAIAITSWMQTARIVRGDVLALKEREFVLAARSIGTPSRRINTRHILPNVMSPIMVSATLGIASAIITESALSFLGLGFPPDFPTWGRMLFDGRDWIEQYPARVIWPGVLISLTVLSVNYIGDGLRDALDPRIRGR
jgi:peptide/nickel transport system permease protein